MLDPSGAAAMFTAVVLVGGLGLERVLLAQGASSYLRLGIPSATSLDPIGAAPAGEGETPTVRWRVSDAEALWWSDRSRRTALPGLHGAVRFRETSQGVALEATWAPPLAPLVATLWLAVLGVARGEALFALTVGGGLFALMAWLYARAAAQALVELREAWVASSSRRTDAP